MSCLHPACVRMPSLCLALALGAVASAHGATPPAEIVIPGERVFPESLTSSADGSVIIGSIGARTIFRAQPGSGNAAAWISPGTDGMQSIFGVFADSKSSTLYACSGSPSFGPPQPGQPPPAPGALYTFDLKTGAPKGHYPLPTAGAGCNDIAVGPDGTAYVTDTTDMQVVRLKKGAKDLDVWAGADGAFGPKGGVLDGIAVLGNRVIVNVLVTSKLFSVPIGTAGTAGSVTEIELDGAITRPDGMRSFGERSLLVAESGNGGRLSRVDLSGAAGKVTSIKEGFPGGPVSVTVVGSTAYVLEGQLGMLMRPDPNAKAQPFHAVAVPVGKP
jgi:sugar lactone lactonase YvrE